MNSKNSVILPRYNDDFQFVQRLIARDSNSWNRFYKEFREKLERHIMRKYPNVFSDVAIEEICDGVGKRLIENGYKTLKSFRGDCTFSTYITKATDWEIKDWLRKHSEELFNSPIDTEHNNISGSSPSPQESESSIPQPVTSLSDDLRWAFLLRYYEYFGFPLEEIRLLAKKKGVPIGSIAKKIASFLEPGGRDVLRSQIEKHEAFQLRLQKICYEIQKLTQKEQGLSGKYEQESKKIYSVKNKRIKLEVKRKAFLKNRIKLSITTSYEVIAEILGEENISTVRSRVFLAKKQLRQEVITKDE